MKSARESGAEAQTRVGITVVQSTCMTFQSGERATGSINQPLLRRRRQTISQADKHRRVSI